MTSEEMRKLQSTIYEEYKDFDLAKLEDEHASLIKQYGNDPKAYPFEHLTRIIAVKQQLTKRTELPPKATRKNTRVKQETSLDDL